MQHRIKHGKWTALAIAAAGALSACGGGGGSAEPVATAAPAASTLTLSGTAATGAALANQTVDAKCASGSASATTAGDGTYTLNVSGGALPCVLRTSLADGSALHAFATGTAASTSAKANLTPATQLVLGRATASEPAAYYANFSSANAASASAGALASAQAAVIGLLKASGVDLSAVGDLGTVTLRAATAAGGGDAYAVALDKLSAALAAAGTTLAGMTTAVVAEAAALDPAVTPATAAASLPADMLLRPAAANCAALRSGTYRAIAPTRGADLADQFGLLTINAATLAVVFTDGSTGTLAANGPCRFLDDNGKTDIVVSAAGVMVWRYTNDNGASHQMAIVFPEQSHSLAELKGDWNFLGLEAAGASYTGVVGTGTVDAAGVQSNITACQNNSTWGLKGSDCRSPAGPFSSLRVNSSGGFDDIDPGQTVAQSRAFAYRAGNGDLMLVGVDGDGSFLFRTRQRSGTPPAAATVSSNWNVYLNGSLASTLALDAVTHVVVSLDAVAQSWLRTSKAVGGSNDHSETLFANNPRAGFTWRTPGTAATPSGATVTVNEFTGLSLRGMGLTPLLLPAPKLLVVSVGQ